MKPLFQRMHCRCVAFCVLVSLLCVGRAEEPSADKDSPEWKVERLKLEIKQLESRLEGKGEQKDEEIVSWRSALAQKQKALASLQNQEVKVTQYLPSSRDSFEVTLREIVEKEFGGWVIDWAYSFRWEEDTLVAEGRKIRVDGKKPTWGEKLARSTMRFSTKDGKSYIGKGLEVNHQGGEIDTTINAKFQNGEWSGEHFRDGELLSSFSQINSEGG